MQDASELAVASQLDKHALGERHAHEVERLDGRRHSCRCKRETLVGKGLRGVGVGCSTPAPLSTFTSLDTTLAGSAHTQSSDGKSKSSTSHLSSDHR